MFCVTSAVTAVRSVRNLSSGYSLFFTDCYGEDYKLRCNLHVYRQCQGVSADDKCLVGFRIVSGAPSYRIVTAVYPLSGVDGSLDSIDLLFSKLCSGGDVA